MRFPIFAAAVATTLALAAGAANAAELCNVPKAEWMTEEALTKLVEAQGYVIASIKEEDGCWEVKGKKDGQRVEAYFDHKSGELVASK